MSKREFAIEVIRALQQQGFEALFAGGCVRDELRGVVPKDYDVATSARPEQVRELFGARRTLAVGVSFGVIIVLGRDRSQQIEVATFRRDLGYSDGRRPDRIEYTDAQGDALRRDYTINGMFLDPIANRVLDFVGGRNDLQSRIVRAIGDPEARIAEDKLRMLRGIRFAALLDFELEVRTAAAIRAHAGEILMVSPERIGAEMRQCLSHPRRYRAVDLLADCHLLAHVVEGGEKLFKNRASWTTRRRWLERLETAQFEQAVVVWLGPLLLEHGVQPLVQRWRLSNAERDAILWLSENWLTVTRAARLPWSAVQPVLAHSLAREAVHVAATLVGQDQCGVAFCRERLNWPKEQLNPPPLISGEDLVAIGLKPGPRFSDLLRQIRNAQLDGLMATPADALAWAREQASH
ncbi:MAG TPA: CCA tRNA nucleotidyltransferase [Pirellulaceae bacterium]|nr:CCA tRNA nucleotidyltransferase [Pirellulaceae bacterium]